MDRDTLALVALVAGLALTLREVLATRRAPGEAETGEFQLEQNQRLGEQLDQERRARRQLEQDYRALDREYQRLVAWGYAVLRILTRCAPNEPVPEMPLRTNGNGTAEPTGESGRVLSLRRLLAERLSDDELVALSDAVIDGDVDPQRCETKAEAVRAILDRVRQKQRDDDLIAWLRRNRRDIKV